MDMISSSGFRKNLIKILIILVILALLICLFKIIKKYANIKIIYKMPLLCLIGQNGGIYYD